MAGLHEATDKAFLDQVVQGEEAQRQLREGCGNTELHQEAINRGSEAFGELFRRYEKRLIYFLSGMVGEEDAKDVLSEVMIAVWYGAKSFEDRSSVSTWIMGIGKNQAYNLIKKSKPQWSHESLESLEEGIGINECIEDIRRALNTLSLDQKTILLLWSLHKKQTAVAKILGVSIEKVKSCLHRARKKMRKARVLERYGSDIVKQAIRQYGLFPTDMKKEVNDESTE